MPSVVTSFRVLLSTNFIQTLSQTLRTQDGWTVVSSQETVFAEEPVLQAELQVLAGMGVGMHASVLPALFNSEYSCSIFQCK